MYTDKQIQETARTLLASGKKPTIRAVRANRAVPAPVSVPTDAGVPFLNNASMSAWQVSGPGADQVANGLVHGAVFVGRGHDA